MIPFNIEDKFGLLFTLLQNTVYLIIFLFLMIFVHNGDKFRASY